MRSTGIVVCILAVAAAFLPWGVAEAKGADTPAADSSQPGPKNGGTKLVAAKPAKKPAEPPPSFITFYWSKGSDSSLFSVFRERMLLSVDGKPAGKLTQGEYISVPVQPGPHTYGFERSAQFSEGETKRDVDVPQGQSVYFEIIEKNEAGIVHTMFPQLVPAEQAQAELSKLKSPLQTAPMEAVTKGAVANEAVTEVAASNPKLASKAGKKGTEPQPVQQSYITFYWPKRTSGTMAFLDSLKEHLGVSIDDQLAGSFSEGEYISVPVQPGPHTYSYARASQISIGEKKHSVDVQQGQSLYFEIAEQQQGMVTVMFPQEVPAEQAQPALANL